MDELIESLRARAAAGRGDKLLEEAAAAPTPAADTSTNEAWIARAESKLAAPVGVPDGMLARVEEAARRVENGHAPRRIPADPADVDLVLGEVIAWLKGEPAPFWVPAAPSPDADGEVGRVG